MPKKTLPWIMDAVDTELYAPFHLEYDAEYYSDLRKRYAVFMKSAEAAGADPASIKIIESFRNKILQSLRDYYKGNIASCHQRIKNLVQKCLDDPFSVSTINDSFAFHGFTDEIQFFRARAGKGQEYTSKEMLHLPYSMRGKTGNYRFSIPGVPSLYLANSSYACWLELRKPSEDDFNVSPVLVDGNLRVLNLAVMNRDFLELNEFEATRVHAWLKMLLIMIATSYRIKEDGRIFKSEYIISQSVMLACKQLGLDGVAYYSRQVSDQVFARPAINLALFAEYRYGKEYSALCDHIMIGDSVNYQMFKQLGRSNADCEYQLRLTHGIKGVRIGSYQRQYEYADTDFCAFDRFLFCGWDRSKITWGNALS